MPEEKDRERTDITIRIGAEIFKLQAGESIFDLLRRQEKTFLSFCGGKGICGRCRIRFLENPTLPSVMDRRIFTPEELRSGLRLACMARPKAECTIELLFPKEREAQDKIVTVYDKTFQRPEGLASDSDTAEGAVIAIDLGTTTIAMQKISGKSGEILGEYRAMNPQRAYGADVISRMEAANRGSGGHLQKLVQEALLTGIRQLAPEKDTRIVLAGNTVMVHLLMGYSVESLSKAPFTPVNLSQKLLLLEDCHIIIMPGISAFVGGDIAAGLLAVDFRNTDKTNLFLDLGTNGELAIGSRRDILCTATAAGPAFEGGATASVSDKAEKEQAFLPVHGSDMIAITAELLEKGILEETGLLKEPYFTEGITIQEVQIKQRDIRDLQMAKAAVYAGIQILLQERGIRPEEIDHVYLAGGFGYHLDVECAKRIGLFPKELAGKVIAVGNTSLLGAYLFGQNQSEYERRAAELTACVKSMNLAAREEFEEVYLGALEFA